MCLLKMTLDDNSFTEEIYNEIFYSILTLQKKNMLKEAVTYLNIFIDILNPLLNVEEDKKIGLIQK